MNAFLFALGVIWPQMTYLLPAILTGRALLGGGDERCPEAQTVAPDELPPRGVDRV